VCGAILGHFAGRWATQGKVCDGGAAGTIALSIATAARAPQMASVLQAPAAAAPRGTQAIIQTACAFSNSLTLPLLYLLTLFSDPAGAAAVTGFTALVLLGWSPLFWTFGYIKLTNAMGLGDQNPKNGASIGVRTTVVPHSPPSWPSPGRSAPDAWPRSAKQPGQLLGDTQLQAPVKGVGARLIDVGDLPTDMRDLPGLNGQKGFFSDVPPPGTVDPNTRLLPAEATSNEEPVASPSGSSSAEIVAGSTGNSWC
jgi:hypothetical protein